MSVKESPSVTPRAGCGGAVETTLKAPLAFDLTDFHLSADMSCLPFAFCDPSHIFSQQNRTQSVPKSSASPFPQIKPFKLNLLPITSNHHSLFLPSSRSFSLLALPLTLLGPPSFPFPLPSSSSDHVYTSRAAGLAESRRSSSSLVSPLTLTFR